MSDNLIAICSVAAVSAVSFSGVVLFTFNQQILQKIMLVLISFSTGAMLGDVFLHMLPEMVEDGTMTQNTWLLILCGILASFILEKFIHWHHCHVVECEEHVHPVGVMNLVGDVLHNALDGILIAGSFLVDVRVGIATTIAVLIHEIPQEMSDIGVLLYSGFSRTKALLFNALTGIAAVLAAVLVLLFSAGMPNIGTFLVPFAAGNLLYIAGSDLIPELHKETAVRRSAVQLTGIVLGIGFMIALTMLE